MTVTPVTEMFVGGTWVNVSGDVYDRDPVTITRGRADESAQVSPSICTLTLNNRDGKYSPRNPNSPYFASIGRNTPIRVSYLRDSVTYRRFTGEVSSWPPKWDLSGNDVWVPVEAAGIIRRLGQGRPPQLSALTRHIKALPGLARHFPLEDSRIREGVPDGAMTVIAEGTIPEFGKHPEFGVDAGPPGTARSLRLRPTHLIELGSQLVPGGWSIQVWVTLGDDALAGPGSEIALQPVTSAGTFHFGWDVSSGAMLLQTSDDDGNETGNFTNNMVIDSPTLVTLWCRDNGVNVRVNVDQLNGDSVVLNSTTTGRGYLASIRGLEVFNGAVFLPPDGDPGGSDIYVSHVAIGQAVDWTDAETRAKTLTAGRAHAGETAGARIERLCLENNIPLQPKGNLAATEVMGPQPVDTTLALLADCASTDMGILHEPRDLLGLAYRTRASMYDQVV